MERVRTWSNVTPDMFDNEIRALAEPAILRGLVADWPLVAAAADTSEAANMLAGMAVGDAFEFSVAPPESKGILHYRPDMQAFTFAKRSARFVEIVQALAQAVTLPEPPVIAIQSLDIDRFFPGFRSIHPMPLLSDDIAPRIWIGNRAKIATHNDPLENIACVAAGHRRFTLFPPDQIGNLYMGPLHITPAGTPISMVHVSEPDMERYPRFAQALEAALVADLEPGDAIYIPYQWYHHVEALDSFNVLVNYWWNDACQDGGSPWDAMLHAILAIRQLPADQRRAWRANFDHYAFLVNGDPAAHLPEFAQGILGKLTPEDMRVISQQLAMVLTKAGPAS